MPTASMFVWAPLPAGAPAPQRRSSSPSALLAEARVAVSPGVGFGPGGEGFVRFALVEPDDRAAAACAAIGRFLRQHIPEPVNAGAKLRSAPTC